jgi:hypothetical protein
MPPHDMHCKTVKDAYQVAADEAERYQFILNKVAQDRGIEEEISTVLELVRLMAKRNAASRIARLIKYGFDVVGHNHEHGPQNRT